MVKMESVFFILGIIFLFATIAYFSYEYLFNLSDSIKTIILSCLVIVFFFVADVLRDKGI